MYYHDNIGRLHTNDKQKRVSAAVLGEFKPFRSELARSIREGLYSAGNRKY